MERTIYGFDDPAVLGKFKEMKRALNFDFIQEDIDDLIVESKDGIERIASIVRNLKIFLGEKTILSSSLI